MTLLDGDRRDRAGLRSRETPRAVIVPVITDGVEFTNRYSSDVVAALERVERALHAVGIGPFVHSDEHGIRERSFLLDDGPAKSGGQRDHAAQSAWRSTRRMQRLARELSSQYKVVYGRPRVAHPAGEDSKSSSARPRGHDARDAGARGDGSVK